MSPAILAALGGAAILALGYLTGSEHVALVGAVPFTLGFCREAADRLSAKVGS